MSQKLQKPVQTVRLTGCRLTKWKGCVVGVASTLGAVALCITTIGAAAADNWPNVLDDTITDLGTLPSGQYSEALAVSADGSVIVGHSSTNRGTHAVAWVDGSTTATDLGIFPDGTSSRAIAVSADGTVIIGTANVSGGASHAASWVDGSTTPTDLGTLAEDPRLYSNARDVSADGSVIVGHAYLDVNTIHATAWVNGSTTAIDLGNLNGRGSFAYGVSADGTVIVGASDRTAVSWVGESRTLTKLTTITGGESVANSVSADGNVIIGYGSASPGSKGVSWVDGNTIGTFLEDLGGGKSRTSGLSADGNVIVGTAETAEETTHAAAWVDGSTAATDLGTLGGADSAATAVSADGNVIVGEASTDDGASHAAAWVDGSTTATDLGTLGGADSVATAVSADGGVIVGTSDTAYGKYSYLRDPHAFIWKTQIQDLDSLLLSFPTLANDTEIASVQQQATASLLMGSTCLAEAGSGCLRIDGVASSTGADDAEDIGSRSNSNVIFSYGRGISDQLTIGGSLAINGTSLHNNGFDQDTGFGGSLWSEYSAGGAARTGLQAGAAISHIQGSSDISRGRGIENVMLATGEADLETTSARVALGYGFQQQNWLLTPSATIEHFETRRDAYAETGSDFNATYDRLAISRTTITLEMNAARKVSKHGTLSLGTGLEHDFSADRATLTGTSDLAGIQDFSISSTVERRKTRGFATVAYTHDFGNNRSLTSSLRVGQSTFGSDPQVRASISFAMGF
ncbi:MAG: autotransporter domain-containing protein [Sulfitobacter sp.]